MSTSIESRVPEWRIILADDHSLFRAGLKKLLQDRPGLTVVGEANDGNQLIELLNRTQCDLVILDVSMPDLDGFRALSLIKKRSPRTRALILSMHAGVAYLKEAVRRGASGFMLKEDAFDRLVWAIEEIRAGRQAFSPTVSAHAIQSVSAADSLALLSGRQKSILEFVAQGMTSKQIGEKLKLSARTVENHRATIMEKMGISNYAGLIKLGLSVFAG